MSGHLLCDDVHALVEEDGHQGETNAESRHRLKPFPVPTILLFLGGIVSYLEQCLLPPFRCKIVVSLCCANLTKGSFYLKHNDESISKRVSNIKFLLLKSIQPLEPEKYHNVLKRPMS